MKPLFLTPAIDRAGNFMFRHAEKVNLECYSKVIYSQQGIEIPLKNFSIFYIFPLYRFPVLKLGFPIKKQVEVKLKVATEFLVKNYKNKNYRSKKYLKVSQYLVGGK